MGWAPLSPRARSLAKTIAALVLDTPSQQRPDKPTLTYFGGHDALILAEYGIDRDADGYDSARRNLSRHIAELIRAGFLTVIEPAIGRKHRPVYRVNPIPVDNAALPLSSDD